MVSHNVDQPKGQFDPEKRPEFSKVFPVSASSEIDSDQGLGSSVGAEKVNDGDSVLDVNPFDVGQPSEAEKKINLKSKKNEIRAAKRILRETLRKDNRGLLIFV